MTPSLPDILLGNVAAISAPMPPEASGDYMAGRMGLMAMLSILGAQEAERGVDTRVWENAALRDVLASAAASADIPQADDLSWGALDRENAALRRALIKAQVAAEDRGDAPFQMVFLKLFKEMADRRCLHLPM